MFFREKILYHLLKMSTPRKKAIPFDRPATYQIVVQGRLDPNWSDLMGGMATCLTVSESTQLVTTLQGELSDQAALHGLLERIRDLNLTLISVTYDVPSTGDTGENHRSRAIAQ